MYKTDDVSKEAITKNVEDGRHIHLLHHVFIQSVGYRADPRSVLRKRSIN